jgi:myo-inositol-1(or 4)-monophosphatase
MFKTLFDIFNECRRCVLKGLPDKAIKRNKKGDITKYFDKYIENLIISNLKKKCRLKAKILSEESDKIIEINKGKQGNHNYVIIDPVDGSDNYSADIPFVCMGISIFNYKKQPVYSFVGNYFSGDWIYADESQLISNNKYLQRKTKWKKILIFTFSKINVKKIRNLQKFITSFDVIRSLGATIGEMMLVANGSAEAFIDVRGKLTLENFTPFFLIAKHRNLKLTDEKGREITLKDFSFTRKYKIIFTENKMIKQFT